MYGSTNGIKERVAMIVNNNKMKAPTLILVLLIMALSVGFTFTAAPNQIKDLRNDEDENVEITAIATKWADAFSQRDAKIIHGLCENEELYLTIGGVAENGEYWMGVSSPWPWNEDYVIDIVDSSTIDIYYYFRTSSPTVYVAKETIKIKKIEGEYKASGDSWKHFGKVESKADFDEAYKFGFPDLTEFAATYQFQADDDANYNQGRKEILENPVTAAIDQLNLTGAKAPFIYTDPYAKKAVIKFAWKDGEVTVNLIQPLFTDESGAQRQATIWLVVNESKLSTSIFSKENVLNIMQDQNKGIQSDSNMALINTYLKSIQDASDDFYDEYFTISPRIDYYNVSIKEISLDNPTNPTSLITFVSEPFVGPHDTVGTDEISFLVDYLGNIKLKEFKHIKSYSLPDNLKGLVKKPIPGDYDM